jgi:2,4-dienoyl-CoA reductase-like NADH-dependent reductase (Old Yellow Enzyme family)
MDNQTHGALDVGLPFARRIHDEADIRTGAVGMIIDPQHADQIITGGDANMVLSPERCCASPTGR